MKYVSPVVQSSVPESMIISLTLHVVLVLLITWKAVETIPDRGTIEISIINRNSNDGQAGGSKSTSVQSIDSSAQTEQPATVVSNTPAPESPSPQSKIVGYEEFKIKMRALAEEQKRAQAQREILEANAKNQRLFEQRQEYQRQIDENSQTFKEGARQVAGRGNSSGDGSSGATGKQADLGNGNGNGNSNGNGRGSVIYSDYRGPLGSCSVGLRDVTRGSGAGAFVGFYNYTNKSHGFVSVNPVVHRRERVHVTVNIASASGPLVLCSYEPTEWHFTGRTENITSVKVLGYHVSNVHGISKSSVTNLTYESGHSYTDCREYYNSNKTQFSTALYTYEGVCSDHLLKSL